MKDSFVVILLLMQVQQSTPSHIPTLARTIFADAINKRASDVHLDPSANGTRIRFRVDGSLSDYTLLPPNYHDQLIQHVKVLAEVNTAGAFTPQDGHFSMNFFYQDDNKNQVPLTVDIRMSVFPSVYGEAAVFRLANSVSHVLDLSLLGMYPDMLEKLQAVIRKNNGMILATGPVGSGKTSTLYSVLNQIMNDEKVAVTLEDPIEFHLDKVRQIQINVDRGFTYASGMKSILRQDPDIILIGEIRDAETAEYAVRAALVGRLILSSLHTNSSIGAVARFIDMGIDKSLIAYAINGVIASRLVKKNCEHCKERYVPSDEYLKSYKLSQTDVFYRGVGCDACEGKGFLGRVGIFEVLPFDSQIRSLIVQGVSMSELENHLEERGFQTLKDDALKKVKEGLTSLESVATAV